MYYLKKNRQGYWVLNREGRRLINAFYKPPKQHGKKHLNQWFHERGIIEITSR